MGVLYHNNRCSKSRNAVEFLTKNAVEFSIVDLLKDEISKAQLEDILSKLNLKPSELIRKSDPFFKENFKEKKYTEEEYLDIMLQYPRLIQRPIFVNDEKAAIGRPIENIQSIL